jgi:hypothetical protein
MSQFLLPTPSSGRAWVSLSPEPEFLKPPFKFNHISKTRIVVLVSTPFHEFQVALYCFCFVIRTRHFLFLLTYMIPPGQNRYDEYIEQCSCVSYNRAFELLTISFLTNLPFIPFTSLFASTRTFTMSQSSPKGVSAMALDHSSIASSSADHCNELKPSNNELSEAPSEPAYPPTNKVLVIMGGLFLVLFLVALDKLIVGVAIPRITDDFNSLGDVGWYGSSYMLTSCAFMLLMGKVYTFVNPKWVYLGSLVVFEVGSAVCGAAPNSTALIGMCFSPSFLLCDRAKSSKHLSGAA